jgi:electron transfer flavoprotein-quinone oxidoreductase
MLSVYKKKLDESFVIKDMKKFSKSVDMMHIDRLYTDYPQLLAGILERVYKVEGVPRSGLLGLAGREASKKVGLGNLVSDGIKIGRALL